MAQTGDVKYGNTNGPDFNLSLAGTGGSDLPNLKAEFTDSPYKREYFSQQDRLTLIVLIVNFLFVFDPLHI